MTIQPKAPNVLADRTVQLLLGAALVVQVLVALRQVGWWHPDSQFGIFEFAFWERGTTPEEGLPFEIGRQVRQTLPIWIYLGFHELMKVLHLDAVYTEQTILRLGTGLLNLALFSAIALHTFRSDRRLTLYTVLFVLCFSWSFPYVRTLFCYENLGGLVYFAAVFLYVRLRQRERGIGMGGAFGVGFLLGISFFLRFQMGFAMLGLGAWLLFVDRPSWKILVGLSTGFLIAAGLNLGLDSAFYGELTSTPWNYWKLNVVEGRADAFGSSSALYYIGILAAALTAPLLSIVLLGYFTRGLWKSIKAPYTLSVITFLAVHFVVGHKEERFLFPIFGILPVILGYGLRDLIGRLPSDGKALRKALPMKSLIVPSLLINAFGLVLSIVIPVCQQIELTRRLNARFASGGPVQLVCCRQMPYETGAGSIARLYLDARHENIEVKTFRTPKAFLEATRDPAPNTYFVCTWKRLVKYGLEGRVAWTRVMASSDALWPVAEWVREVVGWSVPEMWGVFRLEPASPDADVDPNADADADPGG